MHRGARIDAAREREWNMDQERLDRLMSRGVMGLCASMFLLGTVGCEDKTEKYAGYGEGLEPKSAIPASPEKLAEHQFADEELAKARCAREMRCKRLDKHFATEADCRSELTKKGSGADKDKCKDGVVMEKLRACVEAIEKKDCGEEAEVAPLTDFGDACGASSFCP
jgi:hypothetical protein